MNAPIFPSPAFVESTARAVPVELIQALQDRFGTQFSNAMAVRLQNGRDASAFDVPPPAAVVFAQ